MKKNSSAMSVRMSKAFVGWWQVKGEEWERKIYDALVASLLWMFKWSFMAEM